MAHEPVLRVRLFSCVGKSKNITTLKHGQHTSCSPSVSCFPPRDMGKDIVHSTQSGHRQGVIHGTNATFPQKMEIRIRMWRELPAVKSQSKATNIYAKVKALIEEGRFSLACRSLTKDALAPKDAATANTLREKHPVGVSTDEPAEMPKSLELEPNEILDAIRSVPVGSSLSGLRPDHLRDASQAILSLR